MLSTNKAASSTIVLPHYGFGAVAFLFLTIMMLASADSFIGHYFNPKLLAITHTAALAWGSMIIFGALYQFLPVILVSELYSGLLAKATFIVFSTGTSLLIYALWSFSIGLPLQTAACLLFIAISLFTFNIIATSLKAKESNIEAAFIITACVWFWLTALVGILMAFNLTMLFLPKEHLYYLKIHAHIGIVGWFLLLIIGVSSRLIPMFLLSPSVNKQHLKFSYYILNSALLGFFLDSFLFNGISRGLIYLILMFIGIGFYLSFLFLAYKKRAKKKLDFGMKQSMTAFITMSIPLLFSLLINSNIVSDRNYLLQLTMVFGASIFLGVISLLILGQTFKTLPFIVWLKLNKKIKAPEKTPLPKDLYSETLVKWQFAFFIAGLLLLLTGIYFSKLPFIKIACMFLIITAILYNLNVFQLLLKKQEHSK